MIAGPVRFAGLEARIGRIVQGERRWRLRRRLPPCDGRVQGPAAPLVRRGGAPSRRRVIRANRADRANRIEGVGACRTCAPVTGSIGDVLGAGVERPVMRPRMFP